MFKCDSCGRRVWNPIRLLCGTCERAPTELGTLQLKPTPAELHAERQKRIREGAEIASRLTDRRVTYDFRAGHATASADSTKSSPTLDADPPSE